VAKRARQQLSLEPFIVVRQDSGYGSRSRQLDANAKGGIVVRREIDVVDA